jgi:hypothetical protein
MPVINSTAFKKKHGVDPDTSLSLSDIAKLSGFPKAALQEVYNRGIGAFKTNPESVRPQVKSKEQWAFARVYSFVMKRASTFGGSDKDIATKYKLN